MKACPCAGACLHCQICWSTGHLHEPYASPAGLGSHQTAHTRRTQEPRFDPRRALNKGERKYIRKRLEHVALALAAELHLDPATVLAAIPAILRAPRERRVCVDVETIPLSGPGMIVGATRLPHL